ncbi:hypothetical protein FML30_26375 [Klebsiella oxytoca]|nr:hypothetical protein [Klebsiella oxytoca]
MTLLTSRCVQARLNRTGSGSGSGSGRRMLTDDGRQGMGSVAGVGFSTERMQCTVAAAVFENCGQLDNQQLDDIISWIQLYKS